MIGKPIDLFVVHAYLQTGTSVTPAIWINDAAIIVSKLTQQTGIRTEEPNVI